MKDAFRTSDVRGGDPLATYFHARYGDVSEEVQEMADGVDIEHFKHFWSYGTSYPDKKSKGDLSTLRSFAQEIEEFADTHHVYDVQITVSASKNGVNHEAWALYDEPGGDVAKGKKRFEREQWQDSFFDVDAEIGLSGGFNLELFGYYVRNDEEEGSGETPLDTIVEQVDALAEDYDIIDVQTDSAIASSGVYHDVWVFYREEDA